MSQADDYRLMDELSRRWQEYGAARRETISQPGRPAAEHGVGAPQSPAEPVVTALPAGLAAALG